MLDKYEVLQNFMKVSGIDADYVKTLKNETPTIVYSKKVIEKNIQTIKSIITPFEDQLYISLKAINNVQVLQFIANMGLGVDASSYQDYILAKKSGFQNISVTSVNFKDDELLEMKDALINFDNYDQLDQLNNQTIGIRLNVQNICSIKNNRYNRFGFMLDSKLFDFLKTRNLEVNSLHMHISPENIYQFEEMLEFLLKSVFLFPKLTIINLGGGLETYIFNCKFPTIIKNFHDRVDHPIKLIFEPGSLLIEYAGLGISKVLSVKNEGGNHFLFQDFSAWMLIPWGSVNVFNVQEGVDTNELSMSKHPYYVFGNTMFEGDYLGVFNLNYNVAKNHNLFIYPVGAYTLSSFRSFHGISQPNVYLV